MTANDEFADALGMMLPRLRRFAFSLSRSPADADDLAAQAVERALRSRAQFMPGTRLDSWLFRITRNLWIDEARSRQRKAAWEAPPEEGERQGFDGAAAIEQSAELATVMRAMGQLPDEQREVVALIMIEGLGYREAAEALGLPIGTVSSRLVRGRNALLASLGAGADT
ncbi:RNA polymerase sigma factor [Sphingomonas astaxanthinifaciens]|uniref:DNA-directed RNA polymerase sigma-70 factor n=1 Tax=Sphingomonas astaxanthinifaciens DSM 22298 TaxID=1123267 RepID=A0ABQ5ZDC0_9SPHN|nr:RNA polymerase sigma factor [Sphingomonas astaxanthinifaciens]GLR48789.1 DNA-directed RNA polymerase sigma-70 factor [Sphingomonas astaxanthinifaciens DSM 22298]